MQKSTLVALLTIAIPSAGLADIHYKIRVDGLVCPFCVFGIEKKLTKIDGVQMVEASLDKGLIYVLTDDDVQFDDEQLTQLFEDAGFTYRGMESHRADSHRPGADHDQPTG